jgi:hypothetical protein
VGATASLTIACQGLPSQTCGGPVKLTSKVTTQASKAVAVAARSRHKRPKKVTKTVTIATGSYSVAAGHTATIRLRLNSTGQTLLNRFFRLPAILAIGGTTPITKSITFSYGRLHVSPGFTWVITSAFTYAAKLTLPKLPRQAKTTVICRGGGCPFSKRTFSTPKHGTLDLAPALKHRHLAPHSTVEVEITAANTVGEVVLFTIRSGGQPNETFLCLAPGGHSPGACARR